MLVVWERKEDMKLAYHSRSGRKRNYIPDFYLPEYDVYLEVKGYWTDSAKHKMKDVQERNPIKIVILESLEAVNKFSRRKIKHLKK